MRLLSWSTLPFITLVIALFVFAMQLSSSSCVCTEDGSCFCMQKGEALHDVTKEEIEALSDEKADAYRAFLSAWESEYELQTQEWAEQYAAFHREEHSSQERLAFNRSIARAHQSFVALFRYRHGLYRERVGLD